MFKRQSKKYGTKLLLNLNEVAGIFSIDYIHNNNASKYNMYVCTYMYLQLNLYIQSRRIWQVIIKSEPVWRDQRSARIEHYNSTPSKYRPMLCSCLYNLFRKLHCLRQIWVVLIFVWSIYSAQWNALPIMTGPHVWRAYILLCSYVSLALNIYVCWYDWYYTRQV